MILRSLPAIVLLLIAAAPVAAGEPTDRLRTLFDRANRVILGPEAEGGLEERLTAVRALVNEVYDFEGAAPLAFGRHWEHLPEPARVTFTRLYADLVERAYLSWVGSKARLSDGGVNVRWIDETIDGDTARVTSELRARTGGEVSIEYRMVRHAQDWLVRDIVVDGVSLAANYHVQVERVLQQGSYDELLTRLLEKAKPAAREQASAAATAIRAMIAAPAPLGLPETLLGLPETLPVRPVTTTAVVPQPPIARRAVTPPPSAGIVVADLRNAPAAVTSHIPTSAVAVPSAPVRTAATAPVVVAAVAPPAAMTAPRAAIAPSVAATPPAGTIAPSPRREFWVQVGAFRTAEAATRLIERLRRDTVTIATGGDRVAPVMRVLVGPYAERSSAAAAARSLQASGIAAFIPDSAE